MTITRLRARDLDFILGRYKTPILNPDRSFTVLCVGCSFRTTVWLSEEVRPELRHIFCCTKHSCLRNAQGMPLREGHVKFGRYEVKTWDIPYPGRARRYDCRVCWRPFRKIMSAPYCLMEHPIEYRDEKMEKMEFLRRIMGGVEGRWKKERFAVKRAVAAIVKAVVEANV